MACLHELFREQVTRTPEALAVVGPRRTLSYAELDRESDRLAGHLVQLGLGTDDTVGLFMEKSCDYVVGCLAAVKAGGAFLPLFLDYPETLLVKVMEQTSTKVVLTSADLKARFPSQPSCRLLALDEERDWLDSQLPLPKTDPEQLMFVVFSSGTTGEPKGIELPHRAAVHSYQERYKVNDYKPGQRVGCNIFFVWEAFRPLLLGATVVVVGDQTIYDPVSLAKFIEAKKITEILFTPSLLDTLLAHWDRDQWESFTTLDTIWLNGEVVTERLRGEALSKLPSRVQLLNTYSISECHDVASYDLRVSGARGSEFCPVGYPIDGISVRLLEEELLVGGPGLARGYLGKPHLTAERFIELEGERYYRTGDLAQQHDDGMLEIRGRCDSMVKIRGYSVQLGAVVAALENLPGVKSAAARVDGAEGQEKTLVGYVVWEQQPTWDIDPENGTCPSLRESLAESLPDFMIPRVFVTLAQLPLSPITGKLEPKQLPRPPQRKSRPVNDLNWDGKSEPGELILLLFERLLGLEAGRVELNSNFFHLGGHSLMAVRCVRHLERLFKKSLSVRQLYDHPTPAKLTDLLTGGEALAESDRPDAGDWSLDQDIAPPQDLSPTLLSDSRGILLTGATGFLGAFLLAELQRSTEAPIYCLIRAGNSSAQARLEKNMESYGLPLSPQARALTGDLSKNRLGLSSDDYQSMVDKVDLVFHCAALVNYVHGYQVLKPHTVDGTREILRLACVGAGKTLHYVSTNGVYPGGASYLENREIDPYLETLEGGYGLAKWVAEKLVWQAHDRGLPTLIYRPGNVGHHSVTGKANPNDFQYLVLKGCEKLGYAPDVHHWFWEMTPVDLLTRAMATFAGTPAHLGSVFNVVQQPTNPARPFFDELIEKGSLQGYLPLSEWLHKLRQVAERDGEESLEVLADTLPDVEGYLSDTSVYDGRRFQGALSQHGLEAPAAGHPYLHLLARGMAPA